MNKSFSNKESRLVFLEAPSISGESAEKPDPKERAQDLVKKIDVLKDEISTYEGENKVQVQQTFKWFDEGWRRGKDKMVKSGKFTADEIVSDVEVSFLITKRRLERMMGKKEKATGKELYNLVVGLSVDNNRVNRLFKEIDCRITKDTVIKPGIARKWEYTDGKLSGEVTVDYRNKVPIVITMKGDKGERTITCEDYQVESNGEADDADLLGQMMLDITELYSTIVETNNTH